ncbi:MAG TPA: phosphoglycerate kinase [bacterium]|nr:phosphoglycerate kinase [bacterium]
MYLSSIKSAKIQSASWRNKTVLVRCDFDTPIKNGKITDDSRLRAALPTINFLLQKKVKQIILIGHLGRPKGQVVPELSLEPVTKHLEKLLSSCHPERSGAKSRDLKINFINQFTDYLPRRKAGRLQITNYKIVLLENLRFNPAEEKNDKTFAKQLANLADIYINEAFAVSHRSAASVDAVKKFLPSYAGLNLEAEIKNLSTVLEKPQKPFVAIIGGAKIETKLPVIQQFLKTADYILIGGAIANDFLLAQGFEVGESLVDKDYIDEAKKILYKSEILNSKSEKKFKIQNSKLFQNSKLKIKNSQLLLPTDYVWHNNKILDIGEKTIKEYCAILKSAKTIVWNGPLGFFEDKKFAQGTNEIAKAILNSQAHAVIGGGETGEAVKSKVKSQKLKSKKNIFISTGGGAMLEFLGGKKLPGIEK